MTGPNAYLTKRERPSINKHDALDALSVARITAKYIHELPDADIDPLQWALLSTVTHRRGLVGDQNRLKNKLGNLLHQAWPEYRGFSPSRSMA
ncbi:MAG TPA: transposase [Symbiobacteriaceae bacterium]|nr:transposase [Symbiobacteriaceae bacterium]